MKTILLIEIFLLKQIVIAYFIYKVIQEGRKR